jgi:hypothetical protein
MSYDKVSYILQGCNSTSATTLLCMHTEETKKLPVKTYLFELHVEPPQAQKLG